MYLYIYICVFIYIYIYTYLCIYIYVFIVPEVQVYAVKSYKRFSETCSKYLNIHIHVCRHTLFVFQVSEWPPFAQKD